MKILLIATGSVILLGLGVVVIGWLLPKNHDASRRAAYRATPERLYSLIAGSQSWRPDVLHCETVSDAAGRELSRETTRNGETITYELLDRIPPTSIRRRIVTQDLPYSGSWTFSLQAQGEITFVRITENGQVYNPLFRFMSRFVFGYTRTMDNYLHALGKVTGQEIEVKD
jgi:hypothetical protein